MLLKKKTKQDETKQPAVDGRFGCLTGLAVRNLPPDNRLRGTER
jgi:hypothetical protein